MAQRDYGFNMPFGLPGGIYDLSPKMVLTRTLDSGSSVKPGMGLVKGATGGETVKAVESGSTAPDFEGIFVNGSKQLEHGANGTAAVGADTVGVMMEGHIWGLVVSTAKITYGGAVALITDGDNAGWFTDSTDSAETSKVSLTGATFTGVKDADNKIAVIKLRK